MKPIVGVILALTCIILGTTQFLIERQIHQLQTPQYLQDSTIGNSDYWSICGGGGSENNCQSATTTEEMSAQELSDKIDADQKDLQGKIDALADQLNLEYVPDYTSTNDVPAHYEKKDSATFTNVIHWEKVNHVDAR